MYHVRIKTAPIMAEGGKTMGDQMNYGMYTPLSMNGAVDPSRATEQKGVRSFLPSVPRSMANIEAERGETVWGDFNGDAQLEHFKIGGKRHAEGGTALNVPDGSFIFSDTRKLRIGGPILEEFGKRAHTKKKYTFADLARQYDVNKYQAMLGGEQTDKITERTAQLMLDNYTKKLAKLALLQEAIKGFPQGIPKVAIPALQGMMGQMGGLPPAPSEGGGRSVGNSGMQMGQMDNGQMALGNGQEGEMGQGLPRAQVGLWNVPQAVRALQNQASVQPPPTIPSWFKLWTKSNTPKGAISTTGHSTVYDPSLGNRLYDDYVYWSGVAGRPFTSAKDYQQFVYDHVQKANPDGVARMWDYFGPTAAANSTDPNHGFIDGIFGARTAELSHWRPTSAPPPAPVVPGKSKDVPGPIPASFTPWEAPPDLDMPWWLQDKINTGASILDRYGLKKYGPTYVGVKTVLPNPTFYDPARAVAANQESMAQQHTGSALFAGPQQFRAGMSRTSGQGFGNVGNIMHEFAKMNVGVANQFAGARAEIKNNENIQNVSILDAYIKGKTIANQQYDNAVRLANSAMRASVVNGYDNAMDTYDVNRMNPFYNINPENGKIYFKKGLGAADLANMQGDDGDSFMNYKRYYQKYLDEVDASDVQGAREFAQWKAGIKGKSGKDNSEALAFLERYARGKS